MQQDEAELFVCLLKSMRKDETLNLLKTGYGTQVVSLRWQKLAQCALQYIDLGRMDGLFATKEVRK